MNIYKPHINISKSRIVETVLSTSLDAFNDWPHYVQDIALDLSTELFIIYSNPFVDAQRVFSNVLSRLENNKKYLEENEYENFYSKFNEFFADYTRLQEFRERIKQRLSDNLPEEAIGDSPHALIQNATDATGLIMELPLLVLFPENTEQVQKIVQLAQEERFCIVPRGGGSGLTGGAVPALRNSVILSISKLKQIFRVDTANKLLYAQAGVITADAIREAQKHDMLFTVDPASKSASSLGGNISENAGGPYAFEYGTTLDNIYSYKMVRADGEVVEVRRKNHPWHKIYPHEGVCFEVLNQNGELLETISLRGSEIRALGLGKDVTNKFFGGLPGVQKEGVDGIITEACFTLHPELAYSQTLCLEFYGTSMHHASLVIKDLVHLRDHIREQSSLVTMSALEEFGSKYVRSIEYKKKSDLYEGEPISILLVQLDSNNKRVLRDIVWTVVDIVEHYDNVDVFVAEDQEQASLFWEDRHRLSAISKKTSGFKINEDVVIPLDKIPEFSDFLESMNLKYLSLAYNSALNRVRDLHGINDDDEFIAMELETTNKLLDGHILEHVSAEQEFSLQIHYFFQDLFRRYPQERQTLQEIEDDLFSNRLEIANHMHAGDGNCHVNIPVHANDMEMIQQAEQVVDRVFTKVLSLGGQVSGEHGIGITKIGYLSSEKIDDLASYREKVDPYGIMNPEKLSSKEPVVSPYTFSWDRLIQDFPYTDIPHKEQLSQQLKHIQICTRCGKCKQVCPMYYPEKGMLNHPRNKNISMGYLLEALLYTQTISDTNTPDPELLNQLKELMDFCTACGKCMAICPVKIDSADVTINIRSYLESEAPSGWDLKSKMLNFLGQEPERIQTAAKIATLGQNIQHRAVRFLPSFWRRRAQNPMFQAPAPKLEFGQLHDLLDISKGNVFLPGNAHPGAQSAVIYFPGCGSGLFYPSIALAAIYSLLEAGYAVVVPPEHQCCGYPLLSAGCTETFEKNMTRVTSSLKHLVRQAEENGSHVEGLLTSCGTCRAALENYDLENKVDSQLVMQDIFQFLSPYLKDKMIPASSEDEKIVLHSSCHHALSNVNPDQSDSLYADMLEGALNEDVTISTYCCAESGLGALTNPKVYNRLRKRKKDSINNIIEDSEKNPRFLVSCPSCKIGISRSINALRVNSETMHTMEYLVHRMKGEDFKNIIKKEIVNCRKELN
ncbi:MAG: FAD-binding oxidoreductase [Desulfohalobiaceae bacterium]|nr:FAD-binding oxidoreductase [Desulfohalobiaceae bacterium]